MFTNFQTVLTKQHIDQIKLHLQFNVDQTKYLLYEKKCLNQKLLYKFLTNKELYALRFIV